MHSTIGKGNTLTKSKGVGRGRHDPNKQPLNENTESFRNFIRRFRHSPHSKDAYTVWIRRFVKYCNSPDVRAKIGINVNDSTDLLLFEGYNNGEKRTRKIENLVKNYLDYLYKVDHLSPKTVHTYYDAVKHFYQTNDITLNWHNIKDYAGSTSNVVANVDMPYTYEEIHKMLDKADERKRVLIYLFCSTGMRRGAIPLLKIGDLKYIEQYGIYEITVYKGFKEEYKTFCSMECAQAINSYLDFRRRAGENITPDSHLIRKQFNHQNKIGLVKISSPNDPPQKHKVTDGYIQAVLYDLIYDSGVRGYDEKKSRLGDRHKNMVTHSFRKFFENKCLEAGIDPFFVSVLMGHKAGIGVERHYYRPTAINGENSLLELYAKKAMPYLTISEESRLRLKNRELEIRMKEDQERYEKIREETEKMTRATANQFSEVIWKMQREIEELKKNSQQRG
jgi:integrase